MTKQASFSELEYAAKKKQARRDRFLAEIEAVTPWAELERTITPFYPSSGGRGRPPIGLSRMLRMYVAQQCFGLSDEGVEDALYDSQAIRRFVGIVAAWSRAHIAWLRQFLVLKNGIPSEDTFLRVFRLLDPKQFESCFRQWVSSLIPNLGGTIAVDGKTVRGSGHGSETAIHMVSAFAARLGLVLGPEKVSAKSNEITAIPELLDALYLKGFLVSIDAMGCQRAIAEKIIARKADYLLAVKGNQPGLYQGIQDAFTDCKDQIVHVEQVEHGHGRIVAQRCSVLPAAGIVSESDWPRCAVIARVDSVRQVKGKQYGMEQRYYIASRYLAPSRASGSRRSRSFALGNREPASLGARCNHERRRLYRSQGQCAGDPLAAQENRPQPLAYGYD